MPAMVGLLLLFAWLGCTQSYRSAGPIGVRSAKAGGALRSGRGADTSGDLVPYEDLSRLVQKVKREDAEWLQSVFGNSLDDLLPHEEGEARSSENDKDKTTNIDNRNDEEQEQQDEKDDLYREEEEDEEEEDLSEWDEMSSLGYSREDISSIKPSVRLVILERSVQRPRKELPRKWLRTGEDGQPVAARSAPPKAATGGRSKRAAGEGPSVAWSGRPLSEDEQRAAARLREKSREISTNLRRASPSSSAYEGESGPPSFWPDKREFQNMLIDESRWRIDLIGGWVTPFVRAETKWRYGLYKNWLTFLDEGLGDGYDVMPDSFAPSEVDDDDDDDDDNEEVGGAFDDPPPARRAPAAGPRPVRRKAASYDRWVRDELRSGDRGWTDIKAEQRASTRALRDGGRIERSSRLSAPSSLWFEGGEEGEGEGEPQQEDFDKAWSDSLNRREAPLRRRVYLDDDSDDE